jgi:TolB-like protein
VADIFLSYASEDRERIEPLVTILEAEGWTLWWDRDLIAGPSFADKIQENLDQARCILVAWSRHSISSNWCRDEASEGIERNCLVPVLIDDVRPPLGFRSAQTVFLYGWPRDREGVDALLEGISRCLSTRVAVSMDVGRSTGNERSIAVLPFANLSPDADQEYFCDGLVEDITNDLAHIPQLFVVSRNAAFTFKGSVESIRHIAGQLGVSFVLRGSVRKAGNRIRVVATLEEARTSRSVWSNRYDRDAADAFGVQDELTREIVTALDVELLSGAQGLHRRSKFRSAEAGTLLYRGLYEHYRFDRAATLTARKYFEDFTALEPDSILGYVWLATSWGFAIVVGWERPDVALPMLKKWVDKSLAIDPEDAHALTGEAQLKTLSGDLDGALESADRAVARMPNFDEAWFVRGWIQTLLGESDEAIRSLEHAMRLCPTVNSLKLGVLGTALRNAGRYEEAVRTFRRCVEHHPEFHFAHTSMAVVHGMQGDLESARRDVARTLKMDPTYTVKRFISPNLYRDKTVMDRCAEVLRSAGMPDGD